MIQQNARKSVKKNQGQALLEYALAVVLVIGVFSIINRSILKGIGILWLTMAQEIAAPCPGCEPPEQIK